jgi:type II restriction/modification system DNA methylase subunit YeeA
MSETIEQIKKFVSYVKTLDGDEKGESQVFCDRLFKAFGHEGYKEAGASLEFRIKKNSTKGTSFADLVWKPRVLIEMKKRGENLSKHYKQAFDYWLNAVPNRPRFVVICNFDEFYIYDFDKQLNDPVDRIKIGDLPKLYPAFNFLFQEEKEPVFGNDRTEVSKRAASQMAELYKKLIERKKSPISKDQAQRFILQLVICMFSEDIGLLPAATISGIVKDCLFNKQKSFDLFKGLFNQMNSQDLAKGGRFKDVPYFNGGLFSVISPIDLTDDELKLIGCNQEICGASTEDWSKVNPAIFGTLFEHSMDEKSRHQHGRHFTSESDIIRVVGPTIVKPWMARIESASTVKELIELRRDLSTFKVLDPACGSGNFLYVAFREMAQLDLAILYRLQTEFASSTFINQTKLICAINAKQFFGIDNDKFAVELSKVTLMLAKKLAIDFAIKSLSEDKLTYPNWNYQLEADEHLSLPLDNLDENIICTDAIFINWPDADVIIGNPPYQAKNKAQSELSPSYLHKVRSAHPEVDGRADFCVYWFRIAHDNLKQGQRAGLVGTNTIRQNYSRVSGLEYIEYNGGTITEAVSSMIWPGDAVVHVSIVNWIKGDHKGSKRLYNQSGNKINEGWTYDDFEFIGPSLSFGLDVSKARSLSVNSKKGNCFQGITHGHEAFLMTSEIAERFLIKNHEYSQVLKPYLIADDLIGELNGKPSRYVINFEDLDLLTASKYSLLFNQVKERVLPDRQIAAEKESIRNAEIISTNPEAKVNQHHKNFLKKWWKHSYGRKGLTTELLKLNRYIACGRITKRPIFDFVSTDILPNDALTVFPFEDDYTFGILQSNIHWLWFNARCSTLKSDPRYTSNTVFDSFPWPQSPTEKSIKNVAKAAVSLRLERTSLREKHNLSLREIYRILESPGENSLKKMQDSLDKSVRMAYGMEDDADPIAFLFELNKTLYTIEKKGQVISGPGLPNSIKNREELTTLDCIKLITN